MQYKRGQHPPLPLLFFQILWIYITVFDLIKFKWSNFKMPDYQVPCVAPQTVKGTWIVPTCLLENTRLGNVFLSQLPSNVPSVEDLAFRTTRLFLLGMVSHNVACINWAFTNRIKRGYLMFVGEAYWKWVYLLNSKCFIIAVCMVLRGNICSSGFYSEDFHVRGCEVARRKKKKNGLLQTNGRIQSVRRSVAQTLNSSFFYFQRLKKNLKNIHRSTMFLLVIFTILLNRIM